MQYNLIFINDERRQLKHKSDFVFILLSIIIRFVD